MKKFYHIYTNEVVLPKSLCTVDGKFIENITIKDVHGKPNEEFYKWQFIYSMIQSERIPGRDYIGAEIYFPKGNIHSAPIKIDSVVFADISWLDYYRKYRENPKDVDSLQKVRELAIEVPMMIKRTMQTLQDLVIEEMVTKVNYQMEAIRRFNYPYQALEEVVVNAFYHRDYLSYQSIMIEIEPELIQIISFPGIDRSIPQRVIEEGERFSSRYYRNKRLGEFLKELDLSEGKSTGIPTIQEELRNNGSPKARFFTDDDRRAVTVEIPIHPDFLNRDEPQNEPQNKISEKIIELVKENNLISRKEMAEKLGCSMNTIFYIKNIKQRKIKL